MAKRREKSDKPRVHPELEGMNIEVTPLGKVNLQYDLDKLNDFLNRNVRDKKFKGRDDIEGALPYEGPADEDDFKPLANTRTEEDDELPPDLADDDADLPPDLADADDVPPPTKEHLRRVDSDATYDPDEPDGIGRK